MKSTFKILFSSIILLFLSCQEEPKQASISGNIDNLPTSIKKVLIKTPTQIKKIEIIDGVFKDTINVNAEFCLLKIGNFEKTIFLSPTSQLVIHADANDFKNTLTYKGNGKDVNTYLNLRENYTSDIFYKIDSINGLNYNEFKAFKNKINTDINKLLKKYENIDVKVVKTETENLKYFSENLEKQYKAINNIGGSLQKGTISPEFTNYENINGGTTSLKDLRGNYVYIDIWATWCPPCKAEIPFLKKLEKKFHKKNIKFVSISVDNPNAKEAWKKMIKEKDMGGIQLFANGDTSFSASYEVTGIPRFILIDPQGNIISSNAPRPSSNQINDLLEDLP